MEEFTSWPVQLDLFYGDGSRAGHGFPCGPVVLVADQRVDEASGVHHSDVGAVGQENLSGGGDGNAWKYIY